MIDGEIKQIDPFLDAENTKKLRPYIIQQQNEKIMNSLNFYHPLKVTHYKPNNYQCHDIFDHTELEDFVTKDMTKLYKQMFYNFSASEYNYCSICRQYTQTPMETHQIIYCKRLKDFRNN